MISDGHFDGIIIKGVCRTSGVCGEFTVSQHNVNVSIEWRAFIQVAQLSQRDRAAGCVSFGQKWKNGTWIQHSADIIDLSSTTVTIGLQRYRIWCNKTQNKGYYTFKVI